MTISSETKRADYICNGSVNNFSVPFYILDETHIAVYILDMVTGVQTLLTLTTDYTVNNVGVFAGSDIDTVVTYPSGKQLIIIRAVPFTQLKDYIPNDTFPAESHELGLDKLTMLIQQQQEEIDRSLHVPESSTLVNPVLPSLIDNAGKVLMVNPTEDNFSWYDIIGVDPFNPYKYYIDYTAVDQGLSSSRSIKALLDEIGTLKKATLILPHNSLNNETTYNVTTNIIITSNITLERENGAILDGTGTITFNGGFKSELNKAFGSSISVIFGRGSIKTLYPQWQGAKSDTDCTTAIQWAIDVSIASNAGMNIAFPQGVYIVTEPLTANPDGAAERRNVSFTGLGNAGTLVTGSILKYQGTDPIGLIDLDAVQNFHFKSLAFLNDATGIDQLIRIHASSALTMSAWNISFEKCLFQNENIVAKELANGHIWASNTLQMALRDCRFYGSPINMTLGADPTHESGIAGGTCGHSSFENCYFTGDVNLIRASSISFCQGTVFAEKWSNVAAVQSSRLYLKDETYAFARALTLNNVYFPGYYQAGTYTAGAIVLENHAYGINIHGCKFSPSYSRGIKVYSDCDAIDIRGSYADLSASSNAKFLEIGSTFKGRVSMGVNHLSDAMIADGGDLVLDNRAAPYEWPYIVNLLATSDYVIIAGNTWEAALTSGNVTWRAGMYRIKAAILVTGTANYHRVTARITNTDAYTSRVQAELATMNGSFEMLYIDDIVYLPEAQSAAETWSIEVRESTGIGATIKALSNIGVAATFLQILPWNG